MRVIEANSVDEALISGFQLLKEYGKKETSRNGDVLVAPFPVTTVYYYPLRRVLFNPVRDANPFFHLMEALWMLAGRNDAKWLDQFVSDFSARFAEPDGRIHGAYGFRWRHHFDMEGGGSPHLPDQLETVIKLLRANPEDRQAVITMWDPIADLSVSGLRDKPCNTHIYLRVRSRVVGQDGAATGIERWLDMTVCCRSNDIIWGAYGANAVHFSVLQEYLAARIGCGVGIYYQISNNFHGYEATLNDGIYVAGTFPYLDPTEATTPIVTIPETFDQDLAEFMRDPAGRNHLNNGFFEHVAAPMFRANQAWKRKDRGRALLELAQMPARCDWRVAAEQWAGRRMAKAGSLSVR